LGRKLGKLDAIKEETRRKIWLKRRPMVGCNAPSCNERPQNRYLPTYLPACGYDGEKKEGEGQRNQGGESECGVGCQ
jgi:hypothetical protein